MPVHGLVRKGGCSQETPEHYSFSFRSEALLRGPDLAFLGYFAAGGVDPSGGPSPSTPTETRDRPLASWSRPTATPSGSKANASGSRPTSFSPACGYAPAQAPTSRSPHSRSGPPTNA